MEPASDSRSEREQALDRLITEYYQAAERGAAPDHSEFIAQHSAFTGELREFFSGIGQIHAVVKRSPAEPGLAETQGPKDHTGLAPGSVIRYFGDYEIMEELGSGGMGVVYKARQRKLKRIVALKMIKVGSLAGESEIQRFQAEARAAAKLDHPNIVSVLEVGVHEGHHFYTMDFVGGGSLAQRHRDQTVPARRAAELVNDLAKAVHYAHEQGVVHRDLKPSNILLTTCGVPRIADFGLAKQLPTGADSALVEMTETGQILGTAGYMSPEQAAGKAHHAKPPADIYALGAILYALLTGHAPFIGESIPETILQVLNSEPVAPRTLNASVPRDLDTICLKCLEKDSHKRYETGQLLADDLMRFLDGQPVLARPVNRIERGWRWCRRNPLAATVVTLLTLLLAVLSVGGPAWALREAFLRDQLSRETKRASSWQSISAQAQALFDAREYPSEIALAKRHFDNRDVKGVLTHLAATRPEFRGWEYDYLLAFADNSLKTIRLGGSQIHLVAYSPDGRQFVISTSEGLKIYDALTRAHVLTLGEQSAGTTSVAFSPDRRLLATAGPGKTLCLWNANTGESRPLGGNNDDELAQSVAFSADGFQLIGNSAFGEIVVWDVASGRELKRADPSVLGPRGGLSPDGTRLLGVSSAPSSGWLVCNVPGTPEQRFLSLKSDHFVRWAHFSTDGKWIVGQLLHPNSTTSRITLWNSADGREIATLVCDVQCAAVNADASRIATGSSDGSVAVWNTNTGQIVSNCTGLTIPVRCVVFSPDGKLIAACSQNETKFWDVTRPTMVGPQSFSLPGVRASFSPDGTRIATASSHGVKVWDATSGIPIIAMQDDGADASCVAYSPNGKRLAAAYVTAASDKRSVPLEKNPPSQTITHAYGSMRLLSRSEIPSRASLAIWNATSGQRILTLKPKEDLGSVWSLVFSPDGKRLASASGPLLSEEKNDPKLRIWDVESGEQLSALGAFASAPQIISFSADGSHIVCTDRNETTVWNLKDGSRQTANLADGKRADSSATSLVRTRDSSLSPDGKRSAQFAFSPGAELKIVDVQRKTKTFGLPLQFYSVPGKAHVDLDLPRFSSDGSKIMLAGVGLGYESVQVWTSDPSRTAGPIWSSESWRNSPLTSMVTSEHRSGRFAAQIMCTADNRDDTRLTQRVDVTPHRQYLLSGWIKTKNVATVEGNVGANLSVIGGSERSKSVTGTNDWSYESLIIDSQVRTELTIAARLGFSYSAVSGVAWFDDLTLLEIDPSESVGQVGHTLSRPDYLTPRRQAKNLLADADFELEAGQEFGAIAEIDSPFDRFDHAGGRFVKEGPVWREYGHPDPTFAFYFREINRDTTWLYLRDDSRGVDIKLPIRGGQMFLQYYRSSPGEWRPLYIVQPAQMAAGKQVNPTTDVSPMERIAVAPTPIVRFEHSNGRFERQGASWIEYGKEISYTYEFRETNRDDKWIYVRDNSRAMNARIPLAGGTMYLHADDCHPDIWHPYVIVRPITADSKAPSLVAPGKVRDT